jgi:hypothetical protein
MSLKEGGKMSNLAHSMRRTPRRAGLVVCAFSMALALALVWIGHAGAEKGALSRTADVSKSISTVTSKADGADATDLPCTVSPQFNDMPGMLVSFRVSGQASRPVLVLFEGSWGKLNGNTAGFIRLTIDGAIQSGPGTGDGILTLGADGQIGSEGTRGFNFLSDPIAPGLHVARIQWRDNGAGQVCIGERSLIVLHK